MGREIEVKKEGGKRGVRERSKGKERGRRKRKGKGEKRAKGKK